MPSACSKATDDTKDAVFTRLDAYVKHLHATGFVAWKSYSNIPKACIYNMDEAGTDTTTHRGKVLCSILDCMRQYTIHTLTCCLTSRADHMYLLH